MVTWNDHPSLTKTIPIIFFWCLVCCIYSLDVLSASINISDLSQSHSDSQEFIQKFFQYSRFICLPYWHQLVQVKAAFFEEDCKQVQINQYNDEVLIIASRYPKCILAWYTRYFDTRLTGQWKEQDLEKIFQRFSQDQVTSKQADTKDCLAFVHPERWYNKPTLCSVPWRQTQGLVLFWIGHVIHICWRVRRKR